MGPTAHGGHPVAGDTLSSVEATVESAAWFALAGLVFGVPMFSMWDMLRAGERPAQMARGLRWVWAVATMAVTLLGLGLVASALWWLWGRPSAAR